MFASAIFRVIPLMVYMCKMLFYVTIACQSLDLYLINYKL